MVYLDMSDVNSAYGKSHILHDVSLSVERGDLVTLIGRNGAGKTTTLKTIMGLVDPISGSITFEGDRIDGKTPHEISQRGIALIPEHRRIFPQLTVEENLRMGHLGHDIDDPDRILDEVVFRYFPRLKERLGQDAGSLSGGEQQMLTVSRALVSDPDFLLVDEPTEGLMPELVTVLSEALRRINEEQGKTMLLVEQNVDIALDISDYGYVLDEGVIQTHGPSNSLQEDEEIIEKYLAV